MEKEKPINYLDAGTFQAPRPSNFDDRVHEIKALFAATFLRKRIKQADQTKFTLRHTRLVQFLFFLALTGSAWGQIEPKPVGSAEKKEIVDRQGKDSSHSKAREKLCPPDDRPSGDLKSGSSSTRDNGGSIDCPASQKTRDIPPRRIVDRAQVKKYESSLGRFLLAPFRAVSPFVNRRLTQFENGPKLGLLGIIMANPFIHPVIGGLGEGSGFGGGVYLSTADKLSKNYKLSASGVATMNGYTEVLAGMEAAPKNWGRGKAVINVSGRFLLRPEEDFYGSGPNTFRSSHTSYFRREHGARIDASWSAFRQLKIGTFTDFSLNSITEGKDTRVARIFERFNEFDTPGLTRNVRLLDTGVYVEYEGRDERENPHAGTYLRAAASSVDGLGENNDYGWLNYDFDARGYLPLGSKRRVLAMRLTGNFKNTRGSSSVPLHRLARLGDGETLRGYESYRYQGLNALHLNVEYRFKLVQGIETDGFRNIEGILFTDLGQVFNRRQELTFENTHSTYGGGIQFSSRQNVTLKILYAMSPEKSGLILGVGKTF